MGDCCVVRRHNLQILVLWAALMLPCAPAAAGCLKPLIELGSFVIGKVKARKVASLRKSNQRNLADKHRALAVRPLGALLEADPNELVLREYSHNEKNRIESAVSILGADLRALSVTNIYETARNTTLMHGSETAIERFDVDRNADPSKVTESVTAGPGVYNFIKRGDETPWNITERAPKHVYQFEIPKGTTVMDLNDRATSEALDRIILISHDNYSARIREMRARASWDGKSIGVADSEIRRSLAIQDLWRAVGRPQLIIGPAYGESEIVVRDPALLREFDVPIVEYPENTRIRRSSALPF